MVYSKQKGNCMPKGLLIWNSILTVFLIVGLAAAGYYFTVMEQKISVLTLENTIIREAISQQTTVINQQTEVINQQSEFIDHNLNLAYEEYLVTIKDSENTMADMAILIAKYSEVINNDAIYFEEITERLKRLSIVIPQAEANE